MRVLIAVDGSAGGFEAVRQAGQLLSPSADTLAFYYSPPGIKLDSGAADPRVMQRTRKYLADAVFEESRSHLPEPLRAQAETIVGEQAARHGVTVAATQWKADVIVMGARGLGLLQAVTLGSVSRSVVNSATIPVYVARPRADRKPGPLRVLVACDLTQPGEHIARLLQKFTWPTGTVGRAIAVVPSLFAGEIPRWLQERTRGPEAEAMAQAWMAEHAADVEAERIALSGCCAKYPLPFQQAAPIVVEGYPADQILATIEGEDIDLVVLGARAIGPLSRLLLGSTSEAVLSHASCSVLVVREPETP